MPSGAMDLWAGAIRTFRGRGHLGGAESPCCLGWRRFVAFLAGRHPRTCGLSAGARAAEQNTSGLRVKTLADATGVAGAIRLAENTSC